MIAGKSIVAAEVAIMLRCVEPVTSCGRER